MAQFHPELPPHTVPARVDDFIMEKTPCCFILKNSQSEQTIMLNETSALVWQMCDGSTQVKEIIETLKEAYPGAADTMHKDIFRTLDLLYDEGVITLN